MKNEYVNGYEIVRAVCFDDGCGFAYCINEQAALPFAIWQFDEFDGMRIYYRVQYTFGVCSDGAELEYEDIVEGYKIDNPGIMEKYCYFGKSEKRMVA